MRIQKCYFCSGPVYPGHGMAFVRNDCKIFRFCRPKCHKHFKAKHNPRKLAWTKAYRKMNKKQLTNDAIYEFEQQNNQPQQYNRQVYTQTVQAMKKISDIRTKRQERFWKNRMKLSKVKKVSDIQKELEIHGDLISDHNVKEKVRANLKHKVIKKETKRGTMIIQEE